MKQFDALSDNLKGAAVLMLAAALFSLAIALIKLAGERLPVSQILFVRQLGMLLIMSPTLIGNFPATIHTDRPGLQLLRVAFALVAMFCGFTAVVHMPLADAMALGFAKSFFVTVAAVIVLKEIVGPYRWGAVVVGFIGVAIMLKPGTAGFSMYGVMAIAGAAAAGVVMVIIRLLSRTESTNSILGYQVFGVGIVTAIPAMLYWVSPTPGEWVLLLSIGAISFFAQKANIIAYAYGEASMLASLDYIRLLYATALGYLLFEQLPTLTTWIGALVIVLASVFTVYRESRRKQMLARAPDGRGYTNH